MLERASVKEQTKNTRGANDEDSEFEAGVEKVLAAAEEMLRPINMIRANRNRESITSPSGARTASMWRFRR